LRRLNGEGREASDVGGSTLISGRRLLRLWRECGTHVVFGNAAVVVFLVAQCLDGVFTYVGVTTFGTRIEGNPIIALLMSHVGHGVALLIAKGTAGALGMALHLGGVHRAVACLACFYVAAAVLPWVAILLH
jgi:hypothetical protein